MGQTTITVDESTLTRFKELKRSIDDAQDVPDHTNKSFLHALMDTWEAVEDGYYDDPMREDTARKVVEDIREEFGIEGDADVAEIVAQDSLNYDDVVSACRTAIREELPVGEL